MGEPSRSGAAGDAQSDVPPQAVAADWAAVRYKAKPSRRFFLEGIREAHRVMDANEANGKLVVTS
jgi:hypothetical protein